MKFEYYSIMNCAQHVEDQLTDEEPQGVSALFHLDILTKSLDFLERSLSAPQTDAFSASEWRDVLKDARDAVSDLSHQLT